MRTVLEWLGKGAVFALGAPVLEACGELDAHATTPEDAPPDGPDAADAGAREPRTILGCGVGGSTLPLPHGFPLRVVVPRLLGYKNAKYVQRIELTDRPLLGYWVRAGYPYAGEVPASRLRPGKY